MKGLALKALLVVVGIAVVVSLIREAIAEAGAVLASSPVFDVLRNPFFVLAGALTGFVFWAKANEQRLGGTEVLWYRARSRLEREGLRDLVRAEPGKVAVAAGAVGAYLWFSFFGSVFFFLPVLALAYYARRRERRKLSGELSPDGMLVPTERATEPVWEFRRWAWVPGDFEVWFLLGKGYRSRYMYEHVFLASRTGHGKGQDVLLWEAAYSIACGRASTVIADPKAESYDEHAALVAAQPDGPDGRPLWLSSTLRKHPSKIVAGINPCGGPDEAARFASAVIPVPPGENPTWSQGAQKLFRVVAKALGYPPDCVLEVYRYLKHPRLLDELAQRDEEVRSAWRGDEERLKTTTPEYYRVNAENALSALEREEVARLFRASGETIDFARRNVVFICFSPEEDADAKPLLAGLIDYLYAKAYEAGDPEKAGPGVEFIIDEATKCAAIQNFPDYLAIARGCRVRFTICVQNVSQLVDELGEPATQDLLDSLPLKIVGQSGDERTKKLCEEESGEVSVVRAGAGGKPPLLLRMMSFERSRLAEWSGQRWERRHRVLQDHVMSLPKGEWIVLGEGWSKHVIGVPWRAWRKLIVTDKMKALPINRAGVSPSEGYHEEEDTASLDGDPRPEGEPDGGRPAGESDQDATAILYEEPGPGPEEPEPGKRRRRSRREEHKEPPPGQRPRSGPKKRPVLRLVRDANRRNGEEQATRGCPYCTTANASKATDCAECGMPLV